MLAQRLAGIMPPLEFDDALELTKLYSVAGLLGDRKVLMADRPFRAPHHTATSAGLVGRGSRAATGRDFAQPQRDLVSR